MLLKLNVWGATDPTKNDGVSKVMITNESVGYLIHTSCGDNEFDYWVETENEVADYISEFQIVWPPS
ncbi:MAG: hypothetical protein GY822_21355 [Deltaproteobacteria bacterium]|nr:hypothetical protein [Deltaproteobacteria bacterium]